MTLRLTKDDAQEVLHKLCILADTPDLQDDYGLSQQQSDSLAGSVPTNGGEWTVPEWGWAAVRGEMANHCEVLMGIASDARSGGETGQSLRIAKQSHRLERLICKT